MQDASTLPAPAQSALQRPMDAIDGVQLDTACTLHVHMSSETATFAGWAAGSLVRVCAGDGPR